MVSYVMAESDEKNGFKKRVAELDKYIASYSVGYVSPNILIDISLQTLVNNGNLPINCTC